MVKDAPKNSKQHTVYKLKDGTRVPGVTTILGVLNKPALVPWANNLGLQGIKVREYVDDKAAIGTLAHQMIADHLRKQETDTSDYTAKQIDKAENSLLSYFEWEKSHTIEVILVEKPLVSEIYRFGGSIDSLVWLDGLLTLPDIKTSKGIYPEMLTQVVAYLQLVMESVYGLDDTPKGMIIRVGRDETEGFETKQVTHVEERWELFKHCLEIYNLQKELK